MGMTMTKDTVKSFLKITDDGPSELVPAKRLTSIGIPGDSVYPYVRKLSSIAGLKPVTAIKNPVRVYDIGVDLVNELSLKTNYRNQKGMTARWKVVRDTLWNWVNE